MALNQLLKLPRVVPLIPGTGVQFLDLAFTIVHRLPMTFSVGYAAGFEDGSRRGDEWMVSLKIL